jgi:hypothetical protein
VLADPGIAQGVFDSDEDGMKAADISRDNDYEWILEIYSPMISEKFVGAKNENDYYEMRRLTYWALQNSFENDWNERVTLGFSLPQGNPVAILKRNQNAKYGGVRVYYTINKEVGGRYVGIMSREAPFYFPPQQTGVPDKYFPVDIKLYEGENKKSTGNTYYGENDFIGSIREASMSFGVGFGSGIMYGYFKGFGYCEYAYTIQSTLHIDATLFSWGSIKGKKTSTDEYGPQLIAGKGLQLDLGAGLVNKSKWESHNNKGIKIFEGETIGLSFGANIPITGGLIQTCTKLLNPLPIKYNNEDYDNCCCELGIKNCCDDENK